MLDLQSIGLEQAVEPPPQVLPSFLVPVRNQTVHSQLLQDAELAAAIAMSLGQAAPSTDASSAAEPPANSSEDKDSKSKQLAVNLLQMLHCEQLSESCAGSVHGSIAADICAAALVRQRICGPF